MLDISVIILTYNEEVHIHRCIENIKSIAKDIFIVDSFSNDRTVDIAKNLNAKVFQNKWENNNAKQFNWALNNLPIRTKWVLRLDADEYLTEELVSEIKEKLPMLSSDITGIIFKRRHIFLGKWVKHGIYPVKLLRLFQYKKAICEQRLMDEHIQLLEGCTVEFKYDFVDHNLNDLIWWTNKHIGYAMREVADMLYMEINPNANDKKIKEIGRQAGIKRKWKIIYAAQPLFLRSFIYFTYRYFFRFGFLDGKEGFLWHFLQGLWYRILVDAKIFEIKKRYKKNYAEIIEYFRRNGLC
jgi:glycosyltransferase involved in cell wall biosynthesis